MAVAGSAGKERDKLDAKRWTDKYGVASGGGGVGKSAATGGGMDRGSEGNGVAKRVS